MTRDEALELTATTIREVTRWAFGVWKHPVSRRVAATVVFISSIASDEWDALETGPTEEKTEEELAIEAITADLQARGANGISAKAAKELYERGAYAKPTTEAIPYGNRKNWIVGSPTMRAKWAKERKDQKEADRKVRFGQSDEAAIKQAQVEAGESPEESTSNAQR